MLKEEKIRTNTKGNISCILNSFFRLAETNAA